MFQQQRIGRSFRGFRSTGPAHGNRPLERGPKAPKTTAENLRMKHTYADCPYNQPITGAGCPVCLAREFDEYHAWLDASEAAAIDAALKILDATWEALA